MRDSPHPEGKVSECAWWEKVRNEGRKAADLFCPMFRLLLGESFVPTVQFYTATGDCIFV